MGNKDTGKYIEYEDGTRVLLDENDSPEWTEAMFKKAKRGRKALEDILGSKSAAELISGEITMKTIGRPIKETPKIKTTIRLDAEIVEYFRAHGKGWQTDINNALLEWVGRRPE